VLFSSIFASSEAMAFFYLLLYAMYKYLQIYAGNYLLSAGHGVP
jgi:hypothetical protein